MNGLRDGLNRIFVLLETFKRVVIVSKPLGKHSGVILRGKHQLSKPHVDGFEQEDYVFVAVDKI
jgi:hypothetical protein